MFSKNFIAATKEYSEYGKHIPAPYLRKSFTPKAKVWQATVTVCGLGFYELFVNGNRLTKGLLAPYISNPDDILYYDEYDLTAHLAAGKNVLGFCLGNGMLNCPGGTIWDFQDVPYRSAPKLAMALQITYENGEQEQIFADESFKTHPSPILFDDLRIGEIYDANRELAGWNLPEFDDSSWQNAILAETPRGEARLCTAEPITVLKTLQPVSVKKGHITHLPVTRENLPVFSLNQEEMEGHIFDFGENLAGNIRLKISGRKGQTICLQFGELLAEDGGLDLRAMSFQPHRYNHRIVYTLSGNGTEEYAPTFTYQGFRYCLVSGLTPGQAVPELLSYEVMSSALKVNGSFSCSNAIVNQLQKATYNADISNFYYFPTDCPHREKNGWTADAALSAEQMLFHLTPERSYHEWLNNIRKAQREDGALPGIIPTGGWGFAWGNGPAWDSVLFYLPYYTWLYRNDTDIILENAAAFMRYLHYISTKRDSRGLMHIGLGDWVQIGQNTPKAPLEVTDTLMCLDICKKAETMLRAVNLLPQAEFAAALWAEFYQAARKELILSDKVTVLGSCQASQAMAIAYDLFTDYEKPAAFAVLLKLIHEQDDHLDTGCLGARVIFHVLSAFGQADLAYKMITRTDFPSYGHWVAAENCTALFESFLTPSNIPNSKNHHFFGDVSSWFLKNLAGIKVNPYVRNANEVEISPEFISSLDYAEGEIGVPAGKVQVSWRRNHNAVELTLAVPSGVTGELRLKNGYYFIRNSNCKQTVMPVKSGTYTFYKA